MTLTLNVFNECDGIAGVFLEKGESSIQACDRVVDFPIGRNMLGDFPNSAIHGLDACVRFVEEHRLAV